MGALFGTIIFFGILTAFYIVLTAGWFLLTLVKYICYRAMKLGKMPMVEYFNYYWDKFAEMLGL